MSLGLCYRSGAGICRWKEGAEDELWLSGPILASTNHFVLYFHFMVESSGKSTMVKGAFEVIHTENRIGVLA